MYRLTEKGIRECERFILECEAKRKEILDAKMDTANDTMLPTIEGIESDIAGFIDDEGEYYNCWGVTDSYSSDCPISLVLGVHFLDIKDAERKPQYIVGGGNS